MNETEKLRVRAIELAFEYARGLGAIDLDGFLQIVLTMETVISDGTAEAIKARKA